jgi:hypothetical protein
MVRNNMENYLKNNESRQLTTSLELKIGDCCDSCRDKNGTELRR